jgi:hypothetical protein
MKVQKQTVHVLTEPDWVMVFQSEDELMEYLRTALQQQLEQWEVWERWARYEEWYDNREIHTLDIGEWTSNIPRSTQNGLLKADLIRSLSGETE